VIAEGICEAEYRGNAHFVQALGAYSPRRSIVMSPRDVSRSTDIVRATSLKVTARWIEDGLK